MITDCGFQTLKEQYSKSIENDTTGLLKFIQYMYLHNLSDKYGIENSIDQLVEGLDGQTKTYATILRHTTSIDFSRGSFLGSLAVHPQPFYEEAIELGRYINSLGTMTFCETPYLRLGRINYANKCRRIMSKNGQMPKLNNEEIDMMRKEVEWESKHGTNVIHNIFGSVRENDNWTVGGWVSYLTISCCTVPQDELDMWKDAKQKRIDEKAKVEGEWSI